MDFLFSGEVVPLSPHKKKNYEKSVKMTKICPDPPSQVWNFASLFWLRTSPIYITGSSYSGSPFLQHVGISYPLTFRATVLWHLATPITWLSGPLFYGMWHVLQTSPDLMEHNQLLAGFHWSFSYIPVQSLTAAVITNPNIPISSCICTMHSTMVNSSRCTH